MSEPPEQNPAETGTDEHGAALTPEAAAEATTQAIGRLRQADGSSRALRAAKALRGLLPGDSELGDPLSTAGDKPSDMLARRVADVASERPSLTRELGLGALQVWQALSEAQGRGRGDREYTILFTDLVDFSSWALEAGDEATLALLRGVGREEEEAITGHGGRVVKRLGDGAMAVFDDPCSAVEAAHEAAQRVAAIEAPGYEPRLRAGAHLGQPRRIGSDFVGIDVNVAARVAAAAGPGEVLVSGAVCERLPEDRFDVKRRRWFRAKGAPKDLDVFATRPRG